MNDWTSGYVADIGYTFGYYAELNPLRARFALLNAGFVPPNIGFACELGFGQGLSANLHAAGSSVKWYGTDFNPSQASFAQEMAAVSGADAKLYDEAFAEFAARTDLPDFDYIGLHGIWSWISDDNHRVIVDFLRRKLKVGGVLYISYNTMPGWAAFAPMRHLMTEHAEVIGAEGMGIVNRIDGAIAFAERLLAANPAYARANPSIAERINKLKGQSRHYLAHEYFNRDWCPMPFSAMAQRLSAAKLDYACSANYLDHIDGVNLSTEQQTFLKDIPDRMFRETVRDFMVNQQFRRDYWVKGPRRMTALERSEILRDQRVILTAPRSDVPLKVTGSQREATLHEEVYSPILDLLADHEPKTLAQIEQSVRDKNINAPQILEVLMVLGSMGVLMPIQDDSAAAKAKRQTDRINSELMSRARSASDISFLASPLTGGGVAVSRFEQIFLLALSLGKKQPGDWATFLMQILTLQGQKLLKDGKPIENDKETLLEILDQAQNFVKKRLPIFKALQIV